MSAIPEPIQPLLELFATELGDVRFGDIDAVSLASVAAEVEVAADAVSAAQLVLDDARAKLQDRQEALLNHAHRALAYARVYAEANTTLGARLDAIALPRLARRVRADTDDLVLSPDPPAARRQRGRPRKTPLADPVLIMNEATAE